MRNLSQNKGKVNHGEYTKHRQHYNRLVYRFFSSDVFSCRIFWYIFSTQKPHNMLQRNKVLRFFSFPSKSFFSAPSSDGNFSLLASGCVPMPRSCRIIDVQHFTLITGISGMLRCRICSGERVQWNFSSHSTHVFSIFISQQPYFVTSRTKKKPEARENLVGKNILTAIARGRKPTNRCFSTGKKEAETMLNTLGEKLCVLCWRIFFSLRSHKRIAFPLGVWVASSSRNIIVTPAGNSNVNPSLLLCQVLRDNCN